MEQYKKKLRRRIGLLTLAAIFSVGFGIYDVFFAPELIKTMPTFEFQCGFTSTLGLSAMCFVIYFKRIQEDEEALQKQYNKETDERMKLIRAKAGMPVTLFFSVAMIVAGIVAGYFNSIVFYTLIAAGLCLIGTAAVIKAVYMKIM